MERERPDKPSIVTKDQGFQSIADFWGHVSEKKCRIVLGKSIAECILKAKSGNQQYDRVRCDRMQF